MTIRFTQYLRPHGRPREELFEATEEVEAIADRFIAGGGWYECEVLSDEVTVSLTACMRVDGEGQDVAIQVCKNGPEIPAAVERLVRASVEKLKKP
jgi:hypothetical protein